MSRQRINFLQVPARRLNPLSPGGMVWISVGLVVLLALIGLGLRWQVAVHESIASERADALAALERDVAALRNRLPPTTTDDTLAAAVRERARELEQGEQLLNALDQRMRRSSPRFSDVLASLAREPLDGIWLERVVIVRDGGLLFQGQAVDADRVPAFVERLGREPELIGRMFRTLRIDRADTEARTVSFSLIGMGVDDAADQ